MKRNNVYYLPKQSPEHQHQKRREEARQYLDSLREKKLSSWQRARAFLKTFVIGYTVYLVGGILVFLIVTVFALKWIFSTLVTISGGVCTTIRSWLGAAVKMGTGVLKRIRKESDQTSGSSTGGAGKDGQNNRT